MIVTDDNGKPFEKPRREDFASDADYVRAIHAHNDRVTRCANDAFDAEFRAAMKGRKS